MPDAPISPSERNGRPLSDAEFATARDLYETDAQSLAEIAEKFGVSRQALSQRFKTHGVVKGSRKQATLAEQAAKTAAEEKAALANRFETQRPGWIEESRIGGFKALRFVGQATQKLLAEAARSGKSWASLEDDLKALQRANRILVDNTAGILDVLKADEFMAEEDLPNLEISDLTDQDILDHHKRNGVFDEEATVQDMLDEERSMGREILE